MYYLQLIEILSQKKLYVVFEEGWYYCTVLKIFTTKKEAIAFWEKTTKKVWANTDYKKYAVSNNTEGFWYYGLEEVNISDIFNYFKETIINKTIQEKAEEIKTQSEKFINREIKYQISKKMDSILKDITEIFQKNT